VVRVEPVLHQVNVSVGLVVPMYLALLPFMGFYNVSFYATGVSPVKFW